MKTVCSRCYRPVPVSEARVLGATAGQVMRTVYCSDTFAFPGIFVRDFEVQCSHCGTVHVFAVDDEDAPRLRRTYEAEPPAPE